MGATRRGARGWRVLWIGPFLVAVTLVSTACDFGPVSSRNTATRTTTGVTPVETITAEAVVTAEPVQEVVTAVPVEPERLEALSDDAPSGTDAAAPVAGTDAAASGVADDAAASGADDASVDGRPVRPSSAGSAPPGVVEPDGTGGADTSGDDDESADVRAGAAGDADGLRFDDGPDGTAPPTRPDGRPDASSSTSEGADGASSSESESPAGAVDSVTEPVVEPALPGSG